MGRRRSWFAQRALLLGLLGFGMAGCALEPEERLLKAMEAAETQDLDAFTAQFTARSSRLIQDLEAVASRTRGELTYMKDIFSILPRGSVQEVQEEDTRTVVVVATETGTAEVVLLREGGEWKIDGLSLPRMWEPVGGDG